MTAARPGRTSRRRTCRSSAASASIDASAFDAGARLRRGQAAAARRSRAVHLPHARLRQDVDEDRRTASGRTTTCTSSARIRRAAACSTPARSTASTSRTTTAIVGVAVAQPARHAGLGPHRRGQRAGDRDARPRLLHPRRHRAAPAVTDRRSRPAPDAYLFTPADAIRSARRRDDHVLAEEAGAEADDRHPRREADRSSGRSRVRRRRGGAVAAGEQAAAATAADATAWRAGGGATASRREEDDGGGGRGRGGGADRVDGAGLNTRHVGPAYPGATTFPGMMLWGAIDDRSGGAARRVSGAADGRRPSADAAARRHASIRSARRHRRGPAGAVRPRDSDPRQGQRGEQRGDPDPRASSSRSPTGSPSRRTRSSRPRPTR